MSLSDLVYLYRARLRTRSVIVQDLFAIVGIAVGVALLFASQVASTSLTQSVQQLSNQIIGSAQSVPPKGRPSTAFSTSSSRCRGERESGIMPGSDTIVNNYYGDDADRGGDDSRFAQVADKDQDISPDIDDERDNSGDDFSSGDDGGSSDS